MENKKYKLTDESIEVDDKTLYRIEALKDFSDVRKGDKGGFVKSESNLSQEGDCWIYDNACVYDNASVCENAHIFNNVMIHDAAIVNGYACIIENAKIYGNSRICNNARVCGQTMVFDYAYIINNSQVDDKAMIFGNACICDRVIIHNNAIICGDTRISGELCIGNDIKITCDEDYMVFKNWWSSGRFFTWTRSNNMWSVGCFYGTGEELIKKAYKDSEKSGREYERVVKYVEEIKKDYGNNKGRNDAVPARVAKFATAAT